MGETYKKIIKSIHKYTYQICDKYCEQGIKVETNRGSPLRLGSKQRTFCRDNYFSQGPKEKRVQPYEQVEGRTFQVKGMAFPEALKEERAGQDLGAG